MPVGTFTAVLHKEGELYVAECPEVGTVSQGKTVEEAVANLQEATELYLENSLQRLMADPLSPYSRPDLPKLPRVSGAQAIRALEKLGFVQLRQRKPRCTQANRCLRSKGLRNSTSYRVGGGYMAF